MKKNAQNTEAIDSKTLSFDISNLASLQYVKIIFLDSKNKLHEIQTESSEIEGNIIKLSLQGEKEFDVDCPTGAVLKFVTTDSIHFTKTVLKKVRSVGHKLVFVLETPQKIIQKQYRKFNRIAKNRPCVLLFKNKTLKDKTFIAKTVNMSKGGVLLHDFESLSNDQKQCLKLADGDCCYIAIFIKHNITIKSYAKFIRTEYINESYRYGFQFIDMPKQYSDTLDKYIKSEEFKLVQSVKED